MKTINYSYLCDDCYNVEVELTEPLTDKEKIMLEEEICEDCFNDKYFLCTECGE